MAGVRGALLITCLSKLHVVIVGEVLYIPNSSNNFSRKSMSLEDAHNLRLLQFSFHSLGSFDDSIYYSKM